MTKPTIHRDLDNKTIHIERVFNSPRVRVWEAWTTVALLEKWWAPKPWRAVTDSFDFREGGHWHYHMEGPGEEKQWCWTEYKRIDAQNSFSATDAFCDAEGTIRTDMPVNTWDVIFENYGDGTRVSVIVTFTSPEDMNKIIEMGFEEGFSMGLQNLEDLLAQ